MGNEFGLGSGMAFPCFFSPFLLLFFNNSHFKIGSHGYGLGRAIVSFFYGFFFSLTNSHALMISSWLDVLAMVDVDVLMAI